MYDYKTERPFVFTDNGRRMLLRILKRAETLIARAGVVRLDKLMVGGDSWNMLACIDRLVELDELRYVPQVDPCNTQHKILRGGPAWEG